MAKDEGRQLVPDEMLEGLQSLEGFGGFEGESVNEAPAVADAVEEDRRGLFAALMIVGPAALAIPTIPREGHAGAGTLVSGSGNEILEWPDVETTVPNAEPARRVVLPDVDYINGVLVTNDDRIVAIGGENLDSSRLFIIESIDGDLQITSTTDVGVPWGGGALELTPDNMVVLETGGLSRFDPAHPENGLEELIADGQDSFTSADSFTDGEGKVNVLAVGQTSGATNADMLYRICEDDSLVEQNTLPWGTAGKLSVSESKIVLVTNEGVVSMDFDKSNPESLPEAIANYSVLIGVEEAFNEGGIDTVDHNDFGFYVAGMGGGTVKIISKDGGARSTLPVTGNVYGLNQIGESNEYIGDYATPTDTGMVVINGQSEEVQYIPGNFPGVKAVIPSSPGMAELLATTPIGNLHVLADPGMEVTEGPAENSVVVTVDISELANDGDALSLDFLSALATGPNHTINVQFTADDIVLASFDVDLEGTYGSIDVMNEGGQLNAYVGILEDGRLGVSHITVGDTVLTEHEDAGVLAIEEIGNYEELMADVETGDDDDTVESVDDDDAAVETPPGGCGSCEYSNNGSDAVVGLGLVAALAFTAMRKRVRRKIFGK